MRRTITTLACASALLGVLSPAALGNSGVGRPNVDPNDPSLIFWGEVDARDDLEVWEDGAGNLVFRDWFNDVDADTGCSQVDTHTVKCNQVGLQELRIHTFGGPNDVNVDDDVDLRNIIGGGDKADHLNGSDGTQTISGGAGIDVIAGGDNPSGPDQLLDGGPGTDLITGGSGRDRIEAGDDNDIIKPGTDVDVVFGGAGRDRVTYFGRGAGVNVSLDSVQNDGEANEFDNISEDVEDVTGTAHSDTLTGSGKANLLDGEAGPDILEGGENTDTIQGDAGADAIAGGPGTDYVSGGDNEDVISGGSDDDYLFADNGPDTVDGGYGDDVVDGGLGADTLTGGPGDLDQVYYGFRTDPVVAEIGGVGVVNGETDTIGADFESLFGGTKDDVLTGDDGPNYLRGGIGADTLDGLGGVDSLRGDGGADTLESSGDGSADTDNCGADADTVRADPGDTLTDCELVEIVQPPAPPGGGDDNQPPPPDDGDDNKPPPPEDDDDKQPPPPPPPTAGTKVLIAKSAVRVRRGSGRVRLTCPKTAKAICAGRLTVFRSKRKLASARFAISPGRSKRVKLKLRRRGKKVQAVAVTSAPGVLDATAKRTLRLKRVR